MTCRFLDITFPTGFQRLEREYSGELAEHHYQGAPGDEHEDMGDRALMIQCDAELMTTHDKDGKVLKKAEEYFQLLKKAREQRKPDTLFLDNGDSHHVWLKQIRRKDESPDYIRVSLEFVETLDESLRLVKVPPQPEAAIAAIGKELDKIEKEAVDKNIPADKKKQLSKWQQIKALYAAAQAFVQTVRAKINDIKNRIVAIRNLGAGLGRELERLSSDISELVSETQSLFNDLATNPLGTLAIGRSLMNMINNLKGINFQIGIPPLAGGKIASSKIRQRVTTHKVAEGETLQAIARREYGSAALWTVLAEANGIGDLMGVTPGNVLIVPTIPEEQIHGTCKVRPEIVKVDFDAQSSG